MQKHRLLGAEFDYHVGGLGWCRGRVAKISRGGLLEVHYKDLPSNAGRPQAAPRHLACLLYTSDAADDTPCVDLGLLELGPRAASSTGRERALRRDVVGRALGLRVLDGGVDLARCQMSRRGLGAAGVVRQVLVVHFEETTPCNLGDAAAAPA